jgi:hypothetical protein
MSSLERDGGDHFIAAPDETTDAFHKRLKDVARERKAMTVILGDLSNAEPPKEAPSYPARIIN